MSASELPRARITMSAALPGVEFTVVDGDFRQVAHGIGRMSVDLDSGIYEISTRAGGRVETELVALDPGETWSRQDISMEVFSAAPLTRSRTALTGQAETVADWSSAVSSADGPDAGLVLVVRRVDPEAHEPLLYHQLTLLDRNLEAVRAVWDEHDSGAAGMAIRLEPGAYVLRFTPPAGHGPPLDQPLWLAAGWQTLVFCPNGATAIDADNASIHLTRLNEPFLPEAYEAGAAMEIAMSGLRQGMPLVSEDLAGSVPVNPMLGIVGAQALLTDPRPDLDLVRTVIGRLRELLPDHPDVIALRRRLGETAPSVSWPPMLAASYDALLAADRTDPDAILDDSVAERVAGYVVRRGPWLSWEASPAILAPQPMDETRTMGSSATTTGAIRRVQRHVMEVAQLTGASPHQVAAALGVDELARRLELPVQTVRVVLQELGWSTLFMPLPPLPDVPIAARPEVPIIVHPFEELQPAWGLPAGQDPPVEDDNRWRRWLIVVIAVLLFLIAGTAVVLANRDGDGGDGRDEVTVPKTDLRVTIRGDVQGRRITPYVQILNLGPSPARGELTITVPAPYKLVKPVPGCTGEETLICEVGISSGGRVPVSLPLSARRNGSGVLRAVMTSTTEDTNPADNAASVKLSTGSRPTTPRPTITPKPTTPQPTTTPIPTTPLPTSPLPTTPPG